MNYQNKSFLNRQLTKRTLCLPRQRRDPGREDLRHGGHREQRGSGPRQHGDLRPRRQHLDAPAVAALPALQTRLRGHQEVHPERLSGGNASVRPPARPPVPEEEEEEKPRAECSRAPPVPRVSWW